MSHKFNIEDIDKKLAEQPYQVPAGYKPVFRKKASTLRLAPIIGLAAAAAIAIIWIVWPAQPKPQIEKPIAKEVMPQDKKVPVQQYKKQLSTPQPKQIVVAAVNQPTKIEENTITNALNTEDLTEDELALELEGELEPELEISDDALIAYLAAEEELEYSLYTEL